MYVDEALVQVLNVINTIMIPASESEKMNIVKGQIRDSISSLRAKRREAEMKQHKEEKTDEDHHE